MTTMTSQIPRQAGAPADWHLGTLMIWHVTSGQSGGAIAVGEVQVRPGCEPPMHVHANEDESWYVIEGDVLFQRGDKQFLLCAGDALFLPRHVPHGFAVCSAEARMIHAYTPGGIEEAFQAASEPATKRTLPPLPVGGPNPDQVARTLAIFATRGITVVGPPLAVPSEWDPSDQTMR